MKWSAEKLNRTTRRHIRNWKIAAIAVLLLFATILGTYLVRRGNTDSWPETSCTIDGARVIRADVADSYRTIPLYRGEYHLRYVVDGQAYHVWAKSEWADVDKQFVQDRVGARVDSGVDHCNFLIRYNPSRPSDAIAVHK